MTQLSLLEPTPTPPTRPPHPLYAERWPFVIGASNFRSAAAEAAEHARIKRVAERVAGAQSRTAGS